MKKFILFTLLASGLSAHAMLGSNRQENTGQSNKEALAEKAKTQAEVVQGTPVEDLNQRSAFEEDEVMQIDTTQHFVFEESKEDLSDALINQFSSLQIHQDTNNVIEHVKLASNPIGIQEALALKKSGIPVKVGLIADSWVNFWITFLNRNPNNLPFNEWTTEYFDIVSPEKFVIDVYNPHRIPQDLINFLSDNQAHLNPNNFTITATNISTAGLDLAKNSFFLNFLTGVKEFLVYNNRLSLDTLKRCLHNNASTLTWLNLKIENFTETEYLELMPVVANMKLLQSLNLVHNRFSDAAMQSLAHTFTNMPSLQSLNLSGTKFNNEGMHHLVEAISKNSMIKNLTLRKSNIDDLKALILAEAVSNSSIENLFLNNNNIGDVGARALLEAVLNNSTLKILNLQDNDIRDYVKSELKAVCRTKKIDLKM